MIYLGVVQFVRRDRVASALECMPQTEESKPAKSKEVNFHMIVILSGLLKDINIRLC